MSTKKCSQTTLRVALEEPSEFKFTDVGSFETADILPHVGVTSDELNLPAD